MTEQRLHLGRRGAVERPLCALAQIQPRGYSRPLPAAMTDFGAEVSFAQASARLQQHYGIAVPPSAVRLRTLQHGAQLQAWSPPKRTTPDAARVITELDGCLIPLREALTPTATGKCTMPRHWKEVRLCAAWAVGQVAPRYGASLGSVLEVGELWEPTARAAELCAAHDEGVVGAPTSPAESQPTRPGVAGLGGTRGTGGRDQRPRPAGGRAVGDAGAGL